MLRVELAEVPPEEGLFELSARGFDLAIAEQYPGLTRAHRPDLERHTLGLDPLPASTAIQARICRSDLLIEIEAIAMFVR